MAGRTEIYHLSDLDVRFKTTESAVLGPSEGRSGKENRFQASLLAHGLQQSVARQEHSSCGFVSPFLSMSVSRLLPPIRHHSGCLRPTLMTTPELNHLQKLFANKFSITDARNYVISASLGVTVQLSTIKIL